MNLVQIIVPMHNAARYLEETIWSLQAQTYPYWICVLADDGSTDDTKAVARRCMGKDTRFSLCAQPNRGCSAARNFGLAQIPCEFRKPWTIFLDADDVYEPDALALLVFNAARLWCPALGTPYRRINALSEWIAMDSDEVIPEPMRWMDPHIESYDLARYKESLGITNVPAGWIFRTDWIESLGGWDETLLGAEDVDLLLRIAAREPLMILHTHVVRYRRHPQQMTQNAQVIRQGADRIVKIHGPIFSKQEECT